MRRWAALILPLLLAAAHAQAEEVSAPPPPLPSPVSAASDEQVRLPIGEFAGLLDGEELSGAPALRVVGALREEEVLLFEVTLDRGTLTDSLQAYTVGDQLLLPIGELARLLDLNLDVRPREQRIVGRVGSAQRSLLLDLASGTARLNTRAIEFTSDDAVAGLTDIYLSAKLIERLLPVRIDIDSEGLIVALTATEQLPIQAKLERLGRLRGLRPDVDSNEEIFFVDSTPGLLSVPAFDVALEASADAVAPHFRRRYDVRVGADALYMGFQGYVGSDEKGRPSTSRFMFERRDLEGDLLGPIGATRFSVGDVYTPSLAVGPRSIGGRGVSLSTAPLEQTSVFDRVDLRGELPIGFDVELYINDVLRGGEQTPVQGRYEFLDVPLVRGVNVIRIVSYGPTGERSEETRVVNVAGGALPKGELTFDIGAVEQETPLLDLRRGEGQIIAPGEGKLRVTAGVAYGLSEGLTLIGGAALFTPGIGDERILGTAGVRTSLLGYAVQADIAYDDQGGEGLSLGAAGTPLGVSTVVRHAEYRGGLIDEALPQGGEGRALKRHSEATMDFSVGPVAGLTFPLTLRAQRDEFEDGRVTAIAGVRLSTTTSRMLWSAGFDYDRTTSPGNPSLDRLAGMLAASSFGSETWQLRGTIDYEILPTFDIRSIAVTADRPIGDRLALRLGAGHSFAMTGDETTFQAAVIFRLPFADLSLAGDYTAPRDDWRIGLQMAFGIVFDPFRRAYKLARPGPAGGGNAALQAFIDRDGDDRFDPAIDEPVPNIRVTNGSDEATTDAQGQALLTGLGYGTSARLQLDLDGIDNPYVTSPPQTVEFLPRVGHVTRVYYPLKTVGEVLARIQFRDSGGRLTGLSALRVKAVSASGRAIEASTEFDGSVVFERLAVGRYRLELDGEQAERLGMRLVSPVEFVIPADGGFVPDVLGTVVFEGQAATAAKP